MFDSQTLHIGELAERWKKTPRQILDLAQGLRVPLYFHFEGLAFDVADMFHRHGGDMFEARKLEALSAGISRNEAWIRRSGRGETGQWEQRLSSEEAQELRARIEADKEARAALVELLEKRQQDRQKMFFRGFMRAGPSTLFAISAHEAEPFPLKAFHPHSPIKVVTLTDARHDGEQIWEGRMMALEPLPGYESRPAKPLAADDLYAMTAEVKAIEAYWKAQQADTQPPGVTLKAAESQPDSITSRQVATFFDGLPYTAENWPKRLSDTKWLQPAKIALGEVGGITGLWCPLILARLIHGHEKGREQKKALEALNSRFKRNTALQPWRDAWNEHYALFTDAIDD